MPYMIDRPTDVPPALSAVRARIEATVERRRAWLGDRYCAEVRERLDRLSPAREER